MKIIDLLNKIANGEIPKKIIYDDKQWTYNENLEDYITYDDSRIDWKYTIMEYINDEIEIITPNYSTLATVKSIDHAKRGEVDVANTNDEIILEFILVVDEVLLHPVNNKINKGNKLERRYSYAKNCSTSQRPFVRRNYGLVAGGGY